MAKWARLPTVSRLDASLFEDPPGPTPWYLRGGAKGVTGCLWERAGEGADTAGVVALLRGTRPVLLLDFYNYVLPLAADLLLIWHQRRDVEGPTPPIVLRLFRVADLQPLDADVEALCRTMRERGASLTADAAPLTEWEIPTTIVDEARPLVCPNELKDIDELLMLCRSSGVTPASRSNLAIAVVRPRDGQYQLYPQDWWNDGEFDYGYEWVTRVARDPKTKKVHGDGIRIGAFVLDDTLRQKER